MNNMALIRWLLPLGKEGKKRKMLTDIKPIIEDIIKFGIKKIEKSPKKKKNVIDIERMTLFASNVVKRDTLVNTVTFKER